MKKEFFYVFISISMLPFVHAIPNSDHQAHYWAHIAVQTVMEEEHKKTFFSSEFQAFSQWKELHLPHFTIAQGEQQLHQLLAQAVFEDDQHSSELTSSFILSGFAMRYPDSTYALSYLILLADRRYHDDSHLRYIMYKRILGDDHLAMDILKQEKCIMNHLSAMVLAYEANQVALPDKVRWPYVVDDRTPSKPWLKSHSSLFFQDRLRSWHLVDGDSC